MIKGIWLNHFSIVALRQARSNGFNALFINPETYKAPLISDRTKEEILDNMSTAYDIAKQCGFTHFLIDTTWGMYPLDDNKLWLDGFNMFKNDPNVRFEAEELFTNLIDNKSATLSNGTALNEVDVAKLIQAKKKWIGDKLFLGETFRWLDKYSLVLQKATPTAYECWGYYKWIRKNKQPWNCYLCGALLGIDTLTLDHIIPRRRRPDLRYEPSNLKACCFNCNSAKGSKVYDKIIE